MSIRLNKLLAQRGLGARRKCDALIQSGVVRVNGKVVVEPGLGVEPERDRVEVRGRPLPSAGAPAYFVLHKPVGVISTLSDPEGRRTLRDFQPPGARVFPVGRLDADTSGLLILTNDGELAHHLMHPRYGVSKLYRVHADRAPSPEMLRRLQEGIEFEPGVRSAPSRVRVRDTTPGAVVIEFELHEGRYRQVRRMCEAAGLRVLRLHRWGYGPLRLGGLERGLWRELSEEEVRLLRTGSARPQPLPPGFVRGSARPRGRPPGAGPRPSRQRDGEWRAGGRPGERPPRRREARQPEPGPPTRMGARPPGGPLRTPVDSARGGTPRRGAGPPARAGRTGRAFGPREGKPPARDARVGRAYGSRGGKPPARDARAGRTSGSRGGRPPGREARAGRASGSRGGRPPGRDARPGRTSGSGGSRAAARDARAGRTSGSRGGGPPARGGGRPRRAPGSRAGRPRRG